MSARAASAAANAAAELAEANYSVNATIENESFDFQASYAEVMIKMGLRLDPIKFAAERSAPEQEAMFNLDPIKFAAERSAPDVMIAMGVDPIKFAAERSALFTAEHLKAEHEAMFNLCSLYDLYALNTYDQCAHIEVSSGDKSTASHHGSTTTFSATMFTLPRLQAIAEILDSDQAVPQVHPSHDSICTRSQIPCLAKRRRSNTGENVWAFSKVLDRHVLKIYAQCAQDLSTMCWTQYCHRFRFYEAYASSKCSAHSACSLASSKCSACAAHSTSARRRKPYPARFRDRCASATDRDLATFSGVAGHRNAQIMDNTD